MSQTYDNTDSGAVFPPRDNHKMILTGRVNNDGKDSHMVVTMSTLPDGKKIMDIYEKVGTLFPNEKGENPNSPDYTGPIGSRRVAAWRKQKDDMSFMSLSLSDKQQGGNNAEAHRKPVDDSIPF
jgi:hypothetical protein